MIKYRIFKFTVQNDKPGDIFVDIYSNQRFYFRFTIHQSILEYIYNHLNSLKTTKKNHCVNVHIGEIILTDYTASFSLKKPSSFPFYIDNNEKNKRELKKYSDEDPLIILYSSNPIKVYADYLAKLKGLIKQ